MIWGGGSPPVEFRDYTFLSVKIDLRGPLKGVQGISGSGSLAIFGIISPSYISIDPALN